MSSRRGMSCTMGSLSAETLRLAEGLEGEHLAP